MIDYQKILQLYQSDVSQRTISAAIGISRNTIATVISRAKAKQLEMLSDEMTNDWLEAYLFPEKVPEKVGYYPVDLEYIHTELMKKNITLRLLHTEYEHQAVDSEKLAYSYRSFCDKYTTYAKKFKLTMPIKRKPGELMEVDWAGSTLFVTNRNTGVKEKHFIFIATLPYSQYSYVEAFPDMKAANWLLGHIHTLEYFKGVPEAIVPDNLKTGVIGRTKGTPIINKSYRELAEHYQTVILPTRVRAPKDKASVEGTVGFVSRYIIAALRNEHFFSCRDLNTRIHGLLETLNSAAFQKRPGSRKDVFIQEEKQFLKPLPHNRFRTSVWRIAKVQLNYHVQIELMYYSVPYEYTQSEVDIRISDWLIEVYYKETRISSHKRLYGDIGQYSTNKQHMPETHKKFFEHQPEECLEWAEQIGSSTKQLVSYILDTHIQKQALQMLLSLKNLENKYTARDIELAVKTVLEVSTAPNITLVKTVLLRNKKQRAAALEEYLDQEENQETYGFTRGASYFGGKDNE